MLTSLIEKWHPNTHTFHLLTSECTITLEDVAIILGLRSDGMPILRLTISSQSLLMDECMDQSLI
ncbi:hypothetical protein Ahy_A02g006816 [Arachis hypogaea]|uniref:Aminotransferase-like plant mobile domain-containing protein n=1 Tax=Arachis hypogaea TaxID=3818 RepID=A0A445EAW6_ARAHY|nr:hypothetical protein Ahy_A02g006816 [Arachis hypogaea]